MEISRAWAEDSNHVSHLSISHFWVLKKFLVVVVWQSDYSVMFVWLNVCLTWCLSDSMFVWLDVCLTWCLSDSMFVWLDVCLTRCLSDSMLVWLDVSLTRCLSDSMLGAWALFYIRFEFSIKKFYLKFESKLVTVKLALSLSFAFAKKYVESFIDLVKF